MIAIVVMVLFVMVVMTVSNGRTLSWLYVPFVHSVASTTIPTSSALFTTSSALFTTSSVVAHTVAFVDACGDVVYKGVAKR